MGVKFFVQTLKRGWVIFFHASLAIIFNKCHKRAVFMKIFEFVYIKYDLEGGLNFCYKLEGGLSFSCM